MKFSNDVALEPISHKYYDKDGNEYLSVSKFISQFTPQFDKERISASYAAKNNLSQKEVLDLWDAKAKAAIDHGNQIHNALERYEKTTVILPEDLHLKPMILSVASEYSHYHRIYQEQCIFDKDHLIAGTSDKILQVTSSNKSVFDIDDYKTNLSKGIQFYSEYNKYLLGPLSHLQDCNYNKYSIQLSIYAYMLEKTYGVRIRSLGIRFIPPHNILAHHRIPVPYMKAEVEAMFQQRAYSLNKPKYQDPDF